MERTKKIIRTSLIGIGANVFLVGFKSVIGLLSGSIAIVLDAVNNLSDVLSSVITIIGTKLAARAPDRKHPYGHGRIEYVASLGIALLVLFAGVSAAVESVKKIIAPTESSYSAVMLVIIVAAVLIKLFLGLYVRRVGNAIHSNALTASGSDALFDAILSLGTLLAAAVSLLWHVSTEGYIGAIISLFIIKAGVEMLVENIQSIVGTRASEETVKELRESIESFPQVLGVYDIALHNYGPNVTIGSVHIEVDSELTAKEIHKLSRKISAQTYQDYGIVLTIGIYASRKDDPKVTEIRNALTAATAEEPYVLQVHGLFVDDETQTVTFDLVIDFRANSTEVRDRILDKMKKAYPDLSFYAVVDSDYSTSESPENAEKKNRKRGKAHGLDE